jgi:hypothetical protein
LKSAGAHLFVLAFFGVLAALFTWPLPQRLTTVALGWDAGDNLAVIWNFWWVRTALDTPGQSIFWTPDLFAPIGTSLATHTLTPLLTATGALLPRAIEPLVLYNAALIVSVFLNFAVTYAAAQAITHDRVSSTFAAVAFGGAPCVLVRLYGHLNLLSAWVLPLLLLATRHYGRRPSPCAALALSGAIGLVAYTDYYYLVFGLLLVALHVTLSSRAIRVTTSALTPGRRRVVCGLIASSVLVCGVLVWIGTTGGADTTLLGARLRMTDTFNGRVALGFLLAAAMLVWTRPAIHVVPPSVPPNPRVWRFVPLVALATALLIGPIVVLGFRLWLVGDYASQTYFWRSAPPGVDLATLFLGNPLGFAPGQWTATLLDRLDIDRMEGMAWLGLTPTLLLAVAIARLRGRSEAQIYLWIAAVFFVWALGPYLRAFGANTAIMLPQTIVRFVPGLANARIPGRAIIVVQLMVAVLGAMALASIRRSSRGAAIGIAALIAVTLESWPRPHPVVPIGRSALFTSMRALPAGIVMEVPLGIADGIATSGAIDYSILYHQTLHQQPQVGGAISRLSPKTRAAFEADPVIGRILDLSEGQAIGDDAPAGCDATLACGIRYVVVAEAASEELKTFVVRSFALQPLAREADRVLYRVEGLPSCGCGTRPTP